METKKDLIRNTIRELLRISRFYTRIEEMPIPVEPGLEISTREAHTIQAVGNHTRMSVTQVADHLGITKSGASQMITKLVKRDFLIKRQAPHSNKEFELTLSDLGRKAFGAHEHLHGGDMEELISRMEGFSISQIATMAVLLESLGDVMARRLNRRSKKN